MTPSDASTVLPPKRRRSRRRFSTGRITLPIAEPERSRLLEVRCGELPLRTVFDRLHQQCALLEDKVLSTALSDEPDRPAVDAFLVDAYQRVWSGELDRAD